MNLSQKACLHLNNYYPKEYVLWQVAYYVLHLLVCEGSLSMFAYKLPYGYVHNIEVRHEAPGTTW